IVELDRIAQAMTDSFNPIEKTAYLLGKPMRPEVVREKLRQAIEAIGFESAFVERAIEQLEYQLAAYDKKGVVPAARQLKKLLGYFQKLQAQLIANEKTATDSLSVAAKPVRFTEIGWA
ncbi:MAG: hypothetical protein V1826_01510, partial [bacterium]